MILRKIEETDYEVLRLLIEDVETQYQWLWYESIDMLEIDESGEGFGDDFGSEILIHYTKEEFQKDLSEESSLSYAMVENEQIIGQIRLRKNKRNHYQILDWGMFNPANEDARKQTLKELESKRSIHSLTVCTSNDNVKRWLSEQGFESKGGGVLTKKRN